MASGDHDLVAQIEHDALDDSVPIATALRKCVALGGRSGSTALRDWATRELEGYGPDDDLPDYRVVAAPLMIDGISGNYQVTGQQISPSFLPDFVREDIKEEVRFRNGIGELEAFARQPKIMIQPSAASELARYMTIQGGNRFQSIMSLYWSVSPAVMEGVVDQVRTALTKLVAELRATMPSGVEVPSTEIADRAIHYVITGERNTVNISTTQATAPNAIATGTAAQATAPSAVATGTASHAVGEPAAGWSRWRKVGAFIVGTATVVGAVVGVIVWLH